MYMCIYLFSLPLPPLSKLTLSISAFGYGGLNLPCSPNYIQSMPEFILVPQHKCLYVFSPFLKKTHDSD